MIVSLVQGVVFCVVVGCQHGRDSARAEQCKPAEDVAALRLVFVPQSGDCDEVAQDRSAAAVLGGADGDDSQCVTVAVAAPQRPLVRHC